MLAARARRRRWRRSDRRGRVSYSAGPRRESPKPKSAGVVRCATCVPACSGTCSDEIARVIGLQRRRRVMLDDRAAERGEVEARSARLDRDMRFHILVEVIPESTRRRFLVTVGAGGRVEGWSEAARSVKTRLNTARPRLKRSSCSGVSPDSGTSSCSSARHSARACVPRVRPHCVAPTATSRASRRQRARAIDPAAAR